jgi:hypothetical protein
MAKPMEPQPDLIRPAEAAGILAGKGLVYGKKDAKAIADITNSLEWTHGVHSLSLARHIARGNFRPDAIMEGLPRDLAGSPEVREKVSRLSKLIVDNQATEFARHNHHPKTAVRYKKMFGIFKIRVTQQLEANLDAIRDSLGTQTQIAHRIGKHVYEPREFNRFLALLGVTAPEILDKSEETAAKKLSVGNVAAALRHVAEEMGGLPDDAPDHLEPEEVKRVRALLESKKV